MRRSYYALFLIVVFSTLFTSLVQSGDLLLTGFVVDGLHAILVSVEISKGSVLHSDIHTPLGILAFLPIVLLMKFGLGAGAALAYANALIAAILLPAVYWVGITRFTGLVRYLFGAMIILFCMALLHGGQKTGIDVSMYYNRWSWAVTSLIIAIVFLSSPKTVWGPRIDGIILGTSAAFLVFTKLTFAACLGPMVLVALLLRRDWTCLVWTTAISLGLSAILLAMLGGVEFALNYYGDLQTVFNSEVRSFPPYSLSFNAFGPKFFTGSVCLFLALLFLRNSGHAIEGALMLFMAPAVIYISYQNWGNDQFWTLPFAAVLWQLSSVGHSGDQNSAGPSIGLRGVSVVLALTFTPVIHAMLLSNLTHFAVTNSDFDSVLHDPKHASFKVKQTRLNEVRWESKIILVDEDVKSDAVEFGGLSFADCTMKKGEVGLYQVMSRAINAIPEAVGQPVMQADLVQVLPIMAGTVFPRGMSPWYYGGSEGFENVSHLVVPHCASMTTARRQIVETFKEQGYAPTLLTNNKHFAVFRISGGQKG